MNRCDKCKCADCGEGALHFCSKHCAVEYVFSLRSDDAVWLPSMVTVGQDVDMRHVEEVKS